MNRSWKRPGHTYRFATSNGMESLLSALEVCLRMDFEILLHLVINSV